MSASLTSPALRVRPVRDGDRALVAQVYEDLSPRSRQLRFHSPLPRIPGSYVDQLARVDPGRCVGMLAFAGGRPVGHGQWVRDRADPTRADLALAVVDEWHGRGAGLALTGHLARTARLGGVTHFTALVMGENRIVRALLARFGARSLAREEFEIAIEGIPAALAELADSLEQAPAGDSEVAVA